MLPQDDVVSRQKPQHTVAIITRTKNRTLLLRRCIETVLDQTFSRWVHIVVNDGGDPKMVDALVDRYKDRYGGRLHVIHNPKSVGMEAASNIGVRASDSKYIVVLDDDDSWDPRFIEKSIAALEAETWPDTRGIFCHTDIIHERIEGEKIIPERRVEFNRWIHAIDLLTLLSWNRFVPVSFLFERGALDEVGYFDESLPVCGDWEFNIRFLCKYEVAVLREPLAFWHQRPKLRSIYGNSVHQDADLHAIYRARLINRWLREGLAQNKMCLGQAFSLALAADYARSVNDNWWRFKDWVCSLPMYRALVRVKRLVR